MIHYAIKYRVYRCNNLLLFNQSIHVENEKARYIRSFCRCVLTSLAYTLHSFRQEETI